MLSLLARSAAAVAARSFPASSLAAASTSISQSIQSVTQPMAWGSTPSTTSSASASMRGHRGMATNSTDIFNVHRDSPDNNKDTPFEISADHMKRLNEVIARYPPNYKQSAVIPVLDLVQQINGGWLSLAAMNKVAQILEMPEIRVYEVATFYTMFNRTKIGKYHVLVCGTTPCRLNGAQKIEKALTSHLGIHIGETTPCGTFTLGEMECMGACVNAPMVAVADYTKGLEGFTYTYYEDLSPADVIKIVDTLKKGEKPKAGSQYRDKAEPAGAMIQGKGWVPLAGTTTLTGTPRGPFCRDLN